MLTQPAHPCTHCGSLKHWPFQCYKNPKRELILKNHASKRTTKKGDGWVKTKRGWFEVHPPPYQCHYCHKYLEKRETTLDHKIPRSRAPALRHDFDNLVPCCWTCNGLKGSIAHDDYEHKCDSPTLP